MIQNFEKLNERLASLKDLRCGAARNSIGSHLFLEFGTIDYKANTRGFQIPHVELSIGIHADNWHLSFNRSEILNSETISPESLAQIFEKYLSGVGVPSCGMLDFNILTLSFSNELTLFSYGFDDASSGDELDPEMSFCLPSGEIVHLSADSGFS